MKKNTKWLKAVLWQKLSGVSVCALELILAEEELSIVPEGFKFVGAKIKMHMQKLEEERSSSQ